MKNISKRSLHWKIIISKIVLSKKLNGL